MNLDLTMDLRSPRLSGSGLQEADHSCLGSRTWPPPSHSRRQQQEADISSLGSRTWPPPFASRGERLSLLQGRVRGPDVAATEGASAGSGVVVLKVRLEDGRWQVRLQGPHQGAGRNLARDVRKSLFKAQGCSLPAEFSDDLLWEGKAKDHHTVLHQPAQEQVSIVCAHLRDRGWELLGESLQAARCVGESDYVFYPRLALMQRGSLAQCVLAGPEAQTAIFRLSQTLGGRFLVGEMDLPGDLESHLREHAPWLWCVQGTPEELELSPSALRALSILMADFGFSLSAVAGSVHIYSRCQVQQKPATEDASEELDASGGHVARLDALQSELLELRHEIQSELLELRQELRQSRENATNALSQALVSQSAEWRRMLEGNRRRDELKNLHVRRDLEELKGSATQVVEVAKDNIAQTIRVEALEVHVSESIAELRDSLQAMNVSVHERLANSKAGLPWCEPGSVQSTIEMPASPDNKQEFGPACKCFNPDGVANKETGWFNLSSSWFQSSPKSKALPTTGIRSEDSRNQQQEGVPEEGRLPGLPETFLLTPNAGLSSSEADPQPSATDRQSSTDSSGSWFNVR